METNIKGQSFYGFILAGLIICAVLFGVIIYLGTFIQPKPVPAPKINTVMAKNNDNKEGEWATYTSREGQYSFQYPKNVRLSEFEKYSADGVKVSTDKSITLLSNNLPKVNSNYQLSISYQTTEETTLNEFIAKNSHCPAVESDKGLQTSLGGQNALIYEDTPCGPFGMTLIYSVRGGIGYIIEIESHVPYYQIKDYTSQILSTFKFI